MKHIILAFCALLLLLTCVSCGKKGAPFLKKDPKHALRMQTQQRNSSWS